MLSSHDWTPEIVGERLVEAFKLLPGRGVYSPAGGAILSLTGKPIRGAVAIHVAQYVLGHRSDNCIAVLTWARMHAIGGSIGDQCRQRGWSLATLYRHKDAGLATICAWLTAEKERAASVAVAAMLGPVSPL